MTAKNALKPDELEIVWASGKVERIQTQGWAMNGATLMYNHDGHKVIVPSTSIRYFRANGTFTRVP